jgi:hypothetical protein
LLPKTKLGAVLVLVPVGVAAVIGLVVSSPGGDLTAFGRGLATAVGVALLAGVWFYFWTGARATRPLRRRAKERPDSLFPMPRRVGRVEAVFGRRRLIEEIATKATREPEAPPQLIVGDTGSGKTSLLLALALRFAQTGILPIVVSLQGEAELDFVRIAKERFSEYVDPHLSNQADADKVWRRAHQRGEVVLLADDLDRARPPRPDSDPSRTATRVALEAVARRQLPLVVTSRTQGVPRGVSVDVTELGALELKPEEAAQEVRKRLGHTLDKGDNLEHNIKAGNLIANPFYLGIAANLVQLGPLREPGGGEHAVRVALMDAWRDALLGGATTAPQHTAARGEWQRRQGMLELVSDFAASGLLPEGPPVSGALETRLRPQALEAAEQFELVELDEEGVPRFKHDAMHAYFASCALLRSPELVDRVLGLKQAVDAARVQLAFIFAAAAKHNSTHAEEHHKLCQKACKALIAASDFADQRPLLRAAAAAEIASAGAYHEMDPEIAKACENTRRDASPLARRAALHQLAKLSGEATVTALWEFVGDDDYTVRWAAAEKLVERCSDANQVPGDLTRESFVGGVCAYNSLDKQFEKHLGDAEDQSELEDRDEEILPLKHMAWILPTLRTRTNTMSVTNRVKCRLTRLKELEENGVTCEKGLEASLA